MALDRRRLLALALSRGLLIELTGAQIGQKTELLNGALEAAQGHVEGLVFFDSNGRHGSGGCR